MLNRNQKKIKKKNLENLISSIEILKNFEYFVFYGTLLGIVRENNIIEHDDDIDFLINIDHRNEVINKFKFSQIFEINKKVSNKFFIQLISKTEGIETFVDFYFYISEPSKDYIVDKHNWMSSINVDSKAMHIPKKFIYPIKKNKNFYNVNVPQMPVEICKFLYGNNWSKTLRKNSAYRMEIVNNRPMMIKRSFIGNLTRRVKQFFYNQYKKN